MLSADTNSLRHLPRRSSKNCDLQFANSDRFKENCSIDAGSSRHNDDYHTRTLDLPTSLPFSSCTVAGQLPSQHRLVLVIENSHRPKVINISRGLTECYGTDAVQTPLPPVISVTSLKPNVLTRFNSLECCHSYSSISIFIFLVE